jgi:hypothetical protein
MDLSPTCLNVNFLQTSTPVEELSDLDGPMIPREFDLNDDDRMILIKEGTFLYRENSMKGKQIGYRK